MIEILKQAQDKQADVVNLYITVKFSGYHDVFHEVEIFRTYCLPNDQSKDEFLQKEYANWFSYFDAQEEL
jgi:hypothetical protein